jgi:diguanylate cyclase (GGDEF)-like protein/PAS domain S-box-containing protein
MKQFLPFNISGLLGSRKNKFIDSEAESRFLQFTVICCVGYLVMVSFGVYNVALARYPLYLLLFLSAFSLCFGWLLLFQGRAEKLVYRGNCLIFSIILCYIIYLGGEDHSMIVWVSTAPLIVFMLLGSTEGLLWISCLWLGLVVYFFVPLGLPDAHVYGLLFKIRFLVSFTIILIFTYFYENFRHIYRHKLEEKNTLLEAEIAERSRVERSLRESQERYRTIYLHAAEGILLIDFRGEIVECNPQILRMLGYREPDLVGRNVFSLFHHEDLKKTPPQLDKLRAGEAIFIERRVRTATGAYLLCEQSAKKINDDLIILLYRDITERKVAEVALERANEALDRLAHIDGLTQIANRRKFDQVLKSEWQRMKREGKLLGMILSDIDFFKQFNDIYGHQAGDDCLRGVAATLSAMVHRPADLVARYGGEEFMVLLPDTDLEGCEQIAEKMRLAIEALRIRHDGSKVHTVVTMSFGVAATAASGAGTLDDLVGAADRALYRAKESGRNRVC